MDEEEEDARIFPEDGFAGGRIEDVMATAFFDFTLVSAERCDEYNGYTPAEGTQLVDVVIRVYNTFGETLPMFSSDFQIQWGEADDAFGYPVEEITGDDVAPEEYSLHPFETVEYHHVYQVPADSQEYAVAYLEMFDDESTGDMFFVYFELPLEE